MKKLIVLVCLAIVPLVAACENSPVNPLTDSMTATIGVTSWQALLASSATTQGVTIITGTRSISSTSELMSITLTGISTPGTYSIGGISTVSASYKRDSIIYATPVTQLVAAGSLTISQFSSGRVAGTFNFVAFRNGDRATNDSIIVPSGSFNVKMN